MKIITFICFLLLTLFLSETKAETIDDIPRCTCKGIISLESVIADHLLGHEATPMGIPVYWDWSNQPVTHSGIHAGSFQAITLLGNVYEPSEGNPASNTRVHIKDARLYLLTHDGIWKLVQSNLVVKGEAFDFPNGLSKTADIRAEPDGGISVKPSGHFNFHFWLSHADIDPTNIKGILVTVQARLVVENPLMLDDRDIAKFIVNVGADYWIRPEVASGTDTSCIDATKATSGQNNCSVGLGRFKFARKAWRSFSMVAFDPALPVDEALLQNPPPLEITLNHSSAKKLASCIVDLPCAPVYE